VERRPGGREGGREGGEGGGYLSDEEIVRGKGGGEREGNRV